ncbi:MAG: chitobiase/beta-hexosaminidase C-terminal domain-containing protein, partial [Terracidiphilus sp.]
MAFITWAKRAPVRAYRIVLQKERQMNRCSRVAWLLSLTLVFLAMVFTPAVGNATTVATPTFSLVAGSYAGTQSVTISDTTSGATCYYTLTAGTSGNKPGTTSPKSSSSSSISVTVTSVLEAYCVLSGSTDSNVATAAYTITGTLSVYIDAPLVQSSSVNGVTTVTFDGLTTGLQASNYNSNIGTYALPFYIHGPGGLYGGANNTNYFSVGGDSGSSSPTYLTLTQPASYVGFWWAAGDTNNRVALYSGGKLYGTFSTADLLTILNNASGKVTALSGSTYNTSAYFGNPNLTAPNNDSGEPFAYVSFVITDATIDQIAFYNTTSCSTCSSFESDNHSVISSGNTVTIPTTFVPVESMSISPQSVT